MKGKQQIFDTVSRVNVAPDTVVPSWKRYSHAEIFPLQKLYKVLEKELKTYTPVEPKFANVQDSVKVRLGC